MHDASPLVSVMMPVFNREQYIAQALDSILAQDYRPLEVIVVDDGSTDRTAEIVARYDADVVKYSYQKNSGDAAARNACIAKASGNFFAWLDSDDSYLPGKLSAQMHYLREHPECDLVFTGVEDFFEDESLKTAMDPEIYTKVLFGGTKVYFAAMLAGRDLFRRIGPLNESLLLYSDVEWLYRAYFVYNVDTSHCLDRVYVRRRMHANGLAYTTRSPDVLAAVTKLTNEHMRTGIRRRLEQRG